MARYFSYPMEGFMRADKHILIGIALIAVVASATFAQQQGPPKAPAHEVSDTYFGQKIVDPYRWMEDSKNADFVAWMKAQADYTRSQLDQLPMRTELLKRLEELSDTGVRVTGVQRAGDYYF